MTSIEIKYAILNKTKEMFLSCNNAFKKKKSY